jgi:hypothetical protein
MAREASGNYYALSFASKVPRGAEPSVPVRSIMDMNKPLVSV